jgi:hypothetical protein
MPDEAKRSKRGTFLIPLGCLGSAVLIIGICVLAGRLPKAHQWPVLTVLAIALVAAIGIFVADDLRLRLLLLVVSAGLGVSAYLMFFDSTATAGSLGLAASLVLLPLMLTVFVRQQLEDPPRPITRQPIVVSLLVGLTVVLAGLAVAGLTQRSSFQYAKRYGSAVEVTLPDRCWEQLNIKRGDSTTCDDATWTAEGKKVTGTLHAGYLELRDGDHPQSLTANTIRAFAVDSSAYTEHYGTPSRYYQLGLASVWLFLPLPAFLLGLLGLLGLLAWHRSVR